MLAANGQGDLDSALLLERCNSILELLPVYRALSVVLLQRNISFCDVKLHCLSNTYVRLVVDGRDFEVCNGSCMPSGCDLSASVRRWKRVESPGDWTNRLKTP